MESGQFCLLFTFFIALVVVNSQGFVFHRTYQIQDHQVKYGKGAILQGTHHQSGGNVFHMSQPVHEPDQGWGYVSVRPKAHMFYWLYKTTHPSGYKERPLILWLQGGPGGSGTGFGNFGELGPLDVNLQPRNTTWLQTASLLFIDNPVGAGFSYAEDDEAFTTNVAEISSDLLSVMKAFVKKYNEFQETPFYIFSESYGGKMTAAFSAVLNNAIEKGGIKMNFKGFAMGDSWISPVDSTNSWGPYLFATSLVDQSGLNKINAEAERIARLVKEGSYVEATDAWSNAESIVEEQTSGVNFYNILDWQGSGANINSRGKLTGRSPVERLFDRHVKPMLNDDLSELMNGPIRKKLKIIPDEVTWGAQSGKVFEKQAGDFMKNVTSTVNDLINKSKLKVIVYSGQLDLICDVLGTESWFNTLDIAGEFKRAEKEPFGCAQHPVRCFFRKKVNNVEFYWILEAGHMVPADNGSGALDMVNKILG